MVVVVCLCVCMFFLWYVWMCVRLCLCFCFSGTHLLYNFIRNGCCAPMWMLTTTEYCNIPNKLNYFWKYVNSKKTVQWTCFLCVCVFVLACNFVFVGGFHLAYGFELLNRNGDDVYTKRNDGHHWDYCHRKKDEKWNTCLMIYAFTNHLPEKCDFRFKRMESISIALWVLANLHANRNNWCATSKCCNKLSRRQRKNFKSNANAHEAILDSHPWCWQLVLPCKFQAIHFVDHFHYLILSLCVSWFCSWWNKM